MEVEMVKKADDINKILARGKVQGSEEFSERIGAWDCTSCGLKEVRGFVKTCPGCSHNKSSVEEAGEYLPDNALYYTKEDMEQLIGASVNPDWICSYCNTCISDDLNNCSQCSAAKSDTRTQVIRYDPDDAPSSAEEAKLRNKLEQIKEDLFSDAEPEADDHGLFSNIRRNIIPVGLGLGGILLVFGLYWLFFSTYTVDARVDGFKWHREIQIERLNLVIEEDWSVPTGGRQISSSRQIRSYNKVFSHNVTKTRQERYQSGSTSERYKCGTTKTGKGTYSDNYCTRSIPVYSERTVSYQEAVYKDVPVYDTKYRYEVERWQHETTLTKDGIDKNPVWPNMIRLNNRERESGRSESLTVILKGSDGKDYTVTLSEQKWNEVDYGKTCSITLNNVGMIINTTL